MKTIYNTSSVTDYSGEPPVTTYSNTVSTVINEPAPTPVITRYFYNLCCPCRPCCNCGWFDNCCFNNCNCCDCDCD